ncbi:SDR family oxidoreductase [Prochlorococcus sp. MIT 1341]|uniref:SDR family NAD(P)-dependent oxidoreductase n=1 Tax=Prochlorococcus sp. MIT 1341 TaxID=3096221 RepID=UPI002A74BBD2|nr:SDR family oxidoreductase [Prochlorococcus sp. MIT 1341]
MTIFFVTGIGKGIGRNLIDVLLCEPGSSIVGIYRSDIQDFEKLEPFADRLLLIKGDSSEEKVLTSAISLSYKKFYSYPNKFVINAGVRCRENLERIKAERLSYLWKVNYFALRTLIKVLIDKNIIKGISLVYVSSIVASTGFIDLDDYGATKSASESLIRSISLRFPESRFNAISPGFTRSSYEEKFKKDNHQLYDWTLSRIPSARWAECSEISKVIKFLLSEDASYIQAQVFTVDGGWTANG